MYCTWLLEAEGGKGTNVLFGDGHVEPVTAQELDRLKATAQTDTSGSDERGDLTGKWAWTQGLPAPQPSNLFHGEFVLEKDGDAYTGELDDISEGTYGDIIKDVTVVDDRISFTRQGQFGVQQWKGTLKKEDGDLMVVDGQWTKGGIAGIWSAHKID
jgi:prepilin-type processing-associated H-X9-DG protein